MSKTEPRKLTAAYVSSVPLGTPMLIRDTKVTGLMLAVNKRSKTYKVQRDLWQGPRGRRTLLKTVRHTLGTTDELTLDEARLKAEDVIRQIKRGIDPNGSGQTDSAEAWTVGLLYDEYAADLRSRDKSNVTIEALLYNRDIYLGDWRNLPLAALTRSMVRARHQDLTSKRGKVIANRVMRELRAAYNLALRVVDNPDLLPDNPVKAVTFNKERRKGAVIMPDDLADWWHKIQALRNPIRRAMHELAIYSGLRPGKLVALRRDWVKLEERAIRIPTMKSGRSFDLPLSGHMVCIVQRALDLGDMLYPGAPWLFPSRAQSDDAKQGIKKGQVIATQVWREKTLPSETGHLLRHTYRTIAQRICIDKIEARLLIDHTVPGIDGVYIHEKALFDRLLLTQARMTDAIKELLTPSKIICSV